MLITNQCISKQEHPRGRIVEPQCLHQDGLNFLSYNGLNAPIIIALVYDIFLIAKEKKLKLGKVGVVSNIAQNHSSSPYEVISGHYLPQIHIQG